MQKRTVRLIAYLIVSLGLLLAPASVPPALARAGSGRATPPVFALRPSQTTVIAFGGLLGAVYSPKDVFIHPGDSVHWQGDFSMHPLVSDDALWATVSSGSDFTFTFNQTGVYAFHCFFHGAFGMTGTVTVGYQVLLPIIRR